MSKTAEETFTEHVCRNIREAAEREILRFKHKCRLILIYPNGMKLSFNWLFPYAQFPAEQPEVWQTLQEVGFTIRRKAS